MSGINPGPSDPAQELEAVALTPEQIFLINDMIHAWVEDKAEYRESFRSDCKRLLATVRPVSLYREALLDRVVEFDECETPEPTLRKMILGYYMQGLQPDAELARKFADRFILALIEGRA